MSNPVLKVTVFSGKTIEEAAEKANNFPIEKPGLFNASHVINDGGEFKIVILTTDYRE